MTLLWALALAAWTVIVYCTGKAAADVNLVLRLARAEAALDALHQALADDDPGPAHERVLLTPDERDVLREMGFDR